MCKCNGISDLLQHASLPSVKANDRPEGQGLTSLYNGRNYYNISIESKHIAKIKVSQRGGGGCLDDGV